MFFGPSSEFATRFSGLFFFLLLMAGLVRTLYSETCIGIDERVWLREGDQGHRPIANSRMEVRHGTHYAPTIVSVEQFGYLILNSTTWASVSLVADNLAVEDAHGHRNIIGNARDPAPWSLTREKDAALLSMQTLIPDRCPHILSIWTWYRCRSS